MLKKYIFNCLWKVISMIRVAINWMSIGWSFHLLGTATQNVLKTVWVLHIGILSRSLPWERRDCDGEQLGQRGMLLRCRWSVWHCTHDTSWCVLHMPKAIDVRLRNSIEYGVAIVQSDADDGACNRTVHRILVDEWADVCQSSHVVTHSISTDQITAIIWPGSASRTTVQNKDRCAYILVLCA